MAKINREEYEILKWLDDKWKWIARDEDDKLRIHGGGTSKRLYRGLTGNISHLFQFIQWEDEEPYNIQELIEEYENEEFGYYIMKVARDYEQFVKESEETEVKKDIEWLISEIDQRVEAHKETTPYNTGVATGLRSSLFLIDQLDEPEVLSQEFPSVPQFVAEWYENEGKRSSWWNWFYKWGRDNQTTDLEAKTIEWMQDYNEEAFVDMFRYGYAVEEPIYVLKVNGKYINRFEIKDGCNHDSIELTYSSRPHAARVDEKTKVEIEKYLNVEVEELEE